MRPLRLDVTGVTDANGKASIPIKLPVTGEWHLLRLVLTLPAAQLVTWTLQVSGSTIDAGRGVPITLGPHIVQDGELLTLIASSGLANLQVSGSVVGLSGTPEEVLAAFGPGGGSGGGGTGATLAQQALAKIVCGAGVIGATVTLPAGCYGLGLVVINGSAALLQPIVQGVTTGANYYGGPTSGYTAFGADPIFVPVHAGLDGRVLVQFVGSDTGDVIYVTALLAPTTAVVRQNQRDVWNVNLSSVGPGPTVSKLINVTIPGGSQVDLIAAPGITHTIRLWSCTYDIDAGVAAGAAVGLHDPGAAGVAPNICGRPSNGTGSGYFNFGPKGIPITTNGRLQTATSPAFGANPTMRGHIAYSVD